METILRAAGIESAPMDPSSARYLRELIAVGLEKQERSGSSSDSSSGSSSGSNIMEGDDRNANRNAAPVSSAAPTTMPLSTCTTDATNIRHNNDTLPKKEAATMATEATTKSMKTMSSSSKQPSLVSRMRSPPVPTDTAVEASAMTTSSSAEEEKEEEVAAATKTATTTAKKTTTTTKTTAPLLDAAFGKLAAQRPTTTQTKEEFLLEPPPETTKMTTATASKVDDILPPTSSSAVLVLLAHQQKAAAENHSEVLRLLTAHIQDLTDTVHALRHSVETLQRQQQPPLQPQQSWPESSTSTTTPNPSRGAHDHPSAPPRDHTAAASASALNETETENNPNNENENATNNTPNNEFRRAHLLAHHVAWRIATFPVRALLFYLRYEYRIWLVLYRLAKRDILNPFREAGMFFQLAFALVIVYGRIAPALEKALGHQQQQEQQNDDDYYGNDYDAAFVDDAEAQVQTLVTAILAGFLYHVGFFGLIYRFFLRDRLHVRIWKDLKEGVELTPTYGLEFEQVVRVEVEVEVDAHNNNDNDNDNNDVEFEFDENNNDNDNGNDNGNGNDNDNNNRGAANNALRPPNRNPANHNRENDNDNGLVANLFIAIGNGVNEFFIGHHRLRRVAEEEAQADAQYAEVNGNANADTNPNHRNPILGLISDMLCLFYSFFVSILPGWNYEQMLRDIRDEEDRRERERLQREAEALRQQQLQQQLQGEEDIVHSDGDSSESESELEQEDRVDIM